MIFNHHFSEMILSFLSVLISGTDNIYLLTPDRKIINSPVPDLESADLCLKGGKIYFQ